MFRNCNQAMQLLQLTIAYWSVQVTSPVVWTGSTNQIVTSMECLADVDITFKYKSPYFSTEKRLAECEQDKCFLINNALADRYAVERTRQGARLVILKDDIGTRGQYRCCESYNINACDSREIGPPTTSMITVNVHQHTEEDTSGKKATSSIDSKSDTNNIVIVSVVAIVALVIVIVVLIVVFGCSKQFPCQSPFQHTEDPKPEDDKCPMRSSDQMQAQADESYPMLEKEDDKPLQTAIHIEEDELSPNSLSDFEPFHSTNIIQELLEIPNPKLCDSKFTVISTPETSQKMPSDVDVNRKCFSPDEMANVVWNYGVLTGQKATSDVQSCDKITSEEDADRRAGKIGTLETTTLTLGDVNKCEVEIQSNLEPPKSIQVSVRNGITADSEISWDKDENDGNQKTFRPDQLYAPTSELNEDMMQQLGVTPMKQNDQANEWATEYDPDTNYGGIAQKKYFGNGSCPFTFDHGESRIEDELSDVMHLRIDCSVGKESENYTLSHYFYY